MGPNEQNPHFAELRQRLCLYIHAVVLQRGLPSMDGKLKRLTQISGKSGVPNSSHKFEMNLCSAS